MFMGGDLWPGLAGKERGGAAEGVEIKLWGGGAGSGGIVRGAKVLGEGAGKRWRTWGRGAFSRRGGGQRSVAGDQVGKGKKKNEKGRGGGEKCKTDGKWGELRGAVGWGLGQI